MDSDFENGIESGPIPTLFPLPPPSLYFGTNLATGGSCSSPRLYSFQSVIEEPPAFHLSSSIRLDSGSHVQTKLIENRSRPTSYGFDLSTPMSWGKARSSETDTDITEYESRDGNQSPVPLCLTEIFHCDDPHSLRLEKGKFVQPSNDNVEKKDERYWI